MQATGKNFKIWGVRNGWIGDSIMALPVLNYLEAQYPDSYKFWVLWKKYAQAAPIYFNHPLIDRIVVVENENQITEQERPLLESCQVQINTAPTHPGPEDWYNHYSCCEETFRMAGFEVEKFRQLPAEQKKPRLYRYFDCERFSNTIAIWPFAGYNKWSGRSPSPTWWKNMVSQLLQSGFKILHCGYWDEESLSEHANYKKMTLFSFFEQIQWTLGTDLCIDTDSGSSWVVGAYGHPQINLYTNHFPNHHQNFHALAPENSRGQKVDLFAQGGCDNIQPEKVLEAVRGLR